MSDVDELHDQDAAFQQACDAKMKSVVGGAVCQWAGSRGNGRGCLQ